MAKKVYKDFNVLSAQGISDVEMLKAHKGPASYAGTPKVNSYMIMKAYKDNVASGMNKREANVRRIEAQKLVKNVRSQRGY